MLRDGSVEYKRGIKDDLGDLFGLEVFFCSSNWKDGAVLTEVEVE